MTHQVQDCLHHLQICVHYPACLSPLSTFMSHLVLYARGSSGSNLLLVPRVSSGFGSRSFSVAHLEFSSLGYSKQFYHILFSPPTQNLLLQSSFSASAPSQPQPSVSDSAGQSPTLCSLQIHLLTYLLTQCWKDAIYLDWNNVAVYTSTPVPVGTATDRRKERKSDSIAATFRDDLQANILQILLIV